MLDYGREMAVCWMMDGQCPFQERVQEAGETGEVQRREAN